MLSFPFDELSPQCDRDRGGGGVSIAYSLPNPEIPYGRCGHLTCIQTLESRICGSLNLHAPGATIARSLFLQSKKSRDRPRFICHSMMVPREVPKQCPRDR